MGEDQRSSTNDRFEAVSHLARITSHSARDESARNTLQSGEWRIKADFSRALGERVRLLRKQLLVMDERCHLFQKYAATWGPYLRADNLLLRIGASTSDKLFTDE